MTTDYQNIVPPQILPLGQLTVYTASNTTILDAFTMTNISPGDVSVDVYVVPDGNVASEENRIIKNHILAETETYPFYELLNQTLATGTELIIQTDTNAAVNINASGRVISE